MNDERRTMNDAGLRVLDSRFSVSRKCSDPLFFVLCSLFLDGSRPPGMISSVRPDRSRIAHASFTVRSLVEEIAYARADACAARPAAGHPRRRRRGGVPIAQTSGLAGLPGGRAAPQP